MTHKPVTQARAPRTAAAKPNRQQIAKEFETMEEMQRAYAEDLERDYKRARSFMDRPGPGQRPTLTDHLLALLVKDGFTQQQIADRFCVSQSTISRRVSSAYSSSLMEYDEMLASDPAMTTLADPAKASAAAKKLWDAKDSYEQNYAHLLAVAHSAQRASDRIRALSEIRRYMDSAHRTALSLYNSDRVDRFIAAVVKVIKEYDSDAQYKIVSALASRQGGLMPLPTGPNIAELTSPDGACKELPELNMHA